MQGVRSQEQDEEKATPDKEQEQEQKGVQEDHFPSSQEAQEA